MSSTRTKASTTQQAVKHTRARHPRGTANPHRVAQLPPEEYTNVNWLQCLRTFFDRQTPMNQRAIRAIITSHEAGELTKFGFTADQLASALTVVSHEIPPSILAANQSVDFNKLAF